MKTLSADCRANERDLLTRRTPRGRVVVIGEVSGERADRSNDQVDDDKSKPRVRALPDGHRQNKAMAIGRKLLAQQVVRDRLAFRAAAREREQR